MESTKKIVVQGVHKRYFVGSHEIEALSDFEMTVSEGEFVCVVGPSGCGKSTLLRLLGGLARPTSGVIEIQQRDPSRPLTSMVFQDYSVFPWKTVRDNVSLGLTYAGVSKDERRLITDRWLERVGLSEFANSLPRILSGGMRQRVSIARALVVEPEILLMDEPFAALDAQLRTLMQDELLQLWQSDKRTVVFITHNLDEAILLGDRVLVMTNRPGRILKEFTTDIPRPCTPEVRTTARFVELERLIWHELRGEVEAGRTLVQSS